MLIVVVFDNSLTFSSTSRGSFVAGTTSPEFGEEYNLRISYPYKVGLNGVQSYCSSLATRKTAQNKE
jgi:hypothetical protein